jgi:hypothetical protein
MERGITDGKREREASWLGSLLRVVPFGRGKREKSGGWTGLQEGVPVAKCSRAGGRAGRRCSRAGGGAVAGAEEPSRRGPLTGGRRSRAEGWPLAGGAEQEGSRSPEEPSRRGRSPEELTRQIRVGTEIRWPARPPPPASCLAKSKWDLFFCREF